MMLVQLKGPPKITLNIQGCLAVIGSPPGAAESAYLGGGSPCKDPSAQFCNVIVTVASKRGRDRTSTRLNSSHYCAARMPSSACTKRSDTHARTSSATVTHRQPVMLPT